MGGRTGQFCDFANHQLEAYIVDSDQSVVERCIICGWQYFHLITDNNDSEVAKTFLSNE
jgi:hypothetical protein